MITTPFSTTFNTSKCQKNGCRPACHDKNGIRRFSNHITQETFT
nr:MAG TPA: hypothetical protein [Caudoviricetes sp.]